MYINVCNVSNITFTNVSILVYYGGTPFFSHLKKCEGVVENRCVLSSRVWMSTRVQGLCCLTQSSNVTFPVLF